MVSPRAILIARSSFGIFSVPSAAEPGAPLSRARIVGPDEPALRILDKADPLATIAAIEMSGALR
jgi:hypothetical protein